MKSKMATLIIVFVLFTNVSNAQNYDMDKYIKASILINQESGTVLYEKNADQQMPCASLTKMMTLLVTLDSIKNNKVSKNDIVEISSKAAKTRGSTYRLKTGEKVKLINLMKGIMVVSGNDAAVAISEHVGGDTKTFVSMMNKKAKEIGMNKTSYINPNGLPVYGINGDMKTPKENMSTARDLSLLAKYLIDNYKQDVLAITSIKTHTNYKRGFIGNNTNALLRIMPGVDGLKTGFTGRAGYCLASTMNIKSTNENNKDFRVISVVLGGQSSKKRTSASKELLEYAKNNFNKIRIVKKDTFIGKTYLYGESELEINLKTKEDLWVVKKDKEKIERSIILDKLTYPINIGDKVGKINYYTQDGVNVASIDIVSDSEIKTISMKTKLKLFIDKIVN
ncbi:D-alanyl-D-alanine carboxypeptidase family protein [Tepidibacter hydrothermalis]|uniref:serine-type D-Ala-D-Ala carboxypeptidase n=1 Tax=Tepidibacter hydrothermalis TaxID=3036126 RepID=A0ABY8EFC8_9FIRM|nr:D-alanyl-D-alanine carboxypeptidase family protein [Tepidibacter hydrothermalis]WFD11660.1 D-alanyl-D-alanine carboxypeptidase [Tepidibacter hydrothermalis]